MYICIASAYYIYVIYNIKILARFVIIIVLCVFNIYCTFLYFLASFAFPLPDHCSVFQAEVTAIKERINSEKRKQRMLMNREGANVSCAKMLIAMREHRKRASSKIKFHHPIRQRNELHHFIREPSKM